MNQSQSSEPKATRGEFPLDVLVLMPIWLVFAYVSVAFPHKTFHLSSLEVPMTPLLLFFASSLIMLVYFMVTEKTTVGTAGVALLASLFISFIVFFPIPIAWCLLSFYEVSTLPSFLAVLITPGILLLYGLMDWLQFRETEASLMTVKGIAGLPKPLKLMGFYVSALFFGYGTIISVSYLFCGLTNQAFETFARANPAVILLGGATIMAGILALAKPSR